MAKSVDSYAASRSAMVIDLRRMIKDERVLDAFGRVPRERFVPEHLRYRAYDDSPLPIGQGQTISQPLVVAIMLEAMELRGTEKVLDIGTGSGYQAALLSLLAREVISVERVPELTARAAAVLAELGYANVRVLQASRELGYPAEAPYDAIVVAAAAPRIPEALVAQLAVGGRLVVPVGPRSSQELMVVRRTEEGIEAENHGPVRFVPLIGEGAFGAQERWN